MKSIRFTYKQKLFLILIGSMLFTILLIYLQGKKHESMVEISPLDSPIHTSPQPIYSPLPTPNALSRPETWSYYQLWFLGQQTNSVDEFVYVLTSGNLPYGRNETWLKWVAYTPQAGQRLLTQLQDLTSYDDSDVRKRVGEILGIIGRHNTTTGDESARLLTTMICNESDEKLQRQWLRYLSYLPDTRADTTEGIVACIDTMAVDHELISVLGNVEHLPPEIRDEICNVWQTQDTSSKLLNSTLVDMCLTEDVAVEAIQTLLTDYRAGLDMRPFESALERLASDGRFNDTIIKAALDWADANDSFAHTLFILKRFGPGASSTVSDEVAHILMLRPSNNVLDVLGKLSLSSTTQVEVMTFLENLVNDPGQDIYLLSRAAGWYGYLAMELDADAQQHALDMCLTLWDYPEVLNPFHPSALTAVNRLAPQLGPVALQRSIEASLNIAHNDQFYPLPRMRILDNLPKLLADANVTLTTHVVDDLLSLSRSGDSSVRASATGALAALAVSVDGERQIHIAHTLTDAFNEGPIWYSDGGANCTLHISSLTGLTHLAGLDTLDPSARHLTIQTLTHALTESPSPENCLTYLTAGRGLAASSRWIETAMAPQVTATLLTVVNDPTIKAAFMPEVALARIEAAQVLYYGQSLESLWGRFQAATTDSEQYTYGGALFLIALCEAEYRPVILEELEEMRHTANRSKALVGGQVMTMIEILSYSATSRPLKAEAQNVVSFAFQVADIASGDELFLESFCPTKSAGQ